MEASNPNKVIFPEIGLTKQALVDYYTSVADLMLPHMAGRPLTLQRFPDGVTSSGFMQKNASKHFPDFIRRVEVPKSDGTVLHPVVEDQQGLEYLANQGTVTFHIWTSRKSDLMSPDRFVIDLDPEAGDIDGARLAARATGRLLDELDTTPGLMTTGSNGYHVLVALDGSAAFDAVDLAARGVAELLAAENSDRFTTEFRKKERHGRVFIDWLRNRWAQTSVCPWSLRPRPEATVATPIEWQDLDDVSPSQFDVHNHPLVDPLASLPVVDAVAFCAAVATRLEAAGLTIDTDFDRFGRL